MGDQAQACTCSVADAPITSHQGTKTIQQHKTIGHVIFRKHFIVV